MKRSPLQRKTPLKTHSTLKRTGMQRKRKAKSTYTKTLRECIYERDGGRCQLCGGQGEQVHHIITRGRFYSKWYTFDSVHDPINLMLVCHTCHHDIHSKPGVLERAIEIQEKRFGPLRQTVEA